MGLTVELMATLLDDTARLQHESYDMEAARLAQREYESKPQGEAAGLGDWHSIGPDYSKFYRKKLSECAREACLLNEVDLRFAYLVHVTLTNCWNDALGWAEGVKKGLPWDKL